MIRPFSVMSSIASMTLSSPATPETMISITFWLSLVLSSIALRILGSSARRFLAISRFLANFVLG
jgi:hypothetical protein